MQEDLADFSVKDGKVKAIYRDFNARRKMLEARKADEEDLTLFDDFDSLQSLLPPSK